jgi:uncharacterized protein YjbI with pentapeptide repeats
MHLPEFTRRAVFGRLFAVQVLPLATLYGCQKNMDSKKEIRDSGKTLAYLKDPELRRKEVGDGVLTVEGVRFSGEKLEGMEWRNILFRNCDFLGTYEIGPKSSANVRYEDCRFAGILSYGVCDNVHFLRCGWAGQAVMQGEKGSRNTVFEECRFVGADSDPNHWGGVGTDGDARFVRCTAKWFGWQGFEKLELIECELDTCEIETDSPGNSGSSYLSSAVTIEKCKLLGRFSMAACSLQSLSIRDTSFAALDLSNATVKGDILIERVQGGSIKAGIKEGARSFTLRGSQILGDGERVCNVYAGAFQDVLVEDVTFGRVEGQPAGIGGGYEPDDKKPQPVLTRSVTLKKVKAPSLRSARLNAAVFRLESVEIEDANFKEGRIGTVEFHDAHFAKGLDLSRTQVQNFRQSGDTDVARLGGELKLEGSNIKLSQRG